MDRRENLLTITDNCDFVVTNDAPAGDLYPLGDTVVTYTLSDATEETDTATVTVTLRGVNDAPTTLNAIPDQEVMVTADSVAHSQLATQ